MHIKFNIAKIKISIRLSIFSILLLLLCGISLFIIVVNYFNLNTIFVASAKSYLGEATGRAGEQIAHYVDPLNKRGIFTARLINSNMIFPGNTPQFFRYLHDIIIDAQGIQAAKWADVQGNYYRLGKQANDEFFSTVVVNNETGAQETRTVYTPEMEYVSSTHQTVDYDPRIRPWFQIVRFKKTGVWFVYPSEDIGTGKTELSIAMSQPIFNPDQTLRGVFALELPLRAITAFVKSIKVTENSVVVIVNNVGDLISVLSSNISIVNREDMPKIKDVNIPWVERAFNLYNQNYGSTFEFRYNNNNYIAAFEEISVVQGERKWFVGIVTPIQDIIAPLQKNALLTLLVVFAGVLVGIGFSNIFASSLSRPIDKLANDADLICDLQLQKITETVSHIKEVANMAAAFSKMKNVLASFQRYMPVALVKNLITSGKVAEIGGEMKELTIIFTDMENFTHLSENMQPTDLAFYLSEYFQIVAKTIQENFGTVDKYIGDGVMAFWGAPLADDKHAIHACQTVLLIQEALRDLNAKWQREDKPKVATRIGINTGKVVIGNIGSADRLNYTVMGDAVNLTSRLEGLNKLYHTYNLISEFTYAVVKDNFNCRLLDKVGVKGKTNEIFIYELLSVKTLEQNNELEEYNAIFASAFNYYATSDWTNAMELFNQLARLYPNDRLLELYIERCKTFQRLPPQDWNGTWILSEK